MNGKEPIRAVLQHHTPVFVSMNPSSPPPYASTAGPASLDDPPPDYRTARRFKIGISQTKDVLVSEAQIRGHLALLNAFIRLKLKIDDVSPIEYDWPSSVPKDKKRKWSWFVGIAVERFDKWCTTLREADASTPLSVLPPLDVIMVWHAYMLNPRWYIEDSIRISDVSYLRSLGPAFVALLNHPQIDDLLFAEPSFDRTQNWNERTSIPFDYLECTSTLQERKLTCNRCLTEIHAPLMNSSGTGYLQKHFTIRCPKSGCYSGNITKERLALRKLAECLSASGSLESSHLAGTVFSVDGSTTQLERGVDMKTSIRSESLWRYKTKVADGSQERGESSETMVQAIMHEMDYKLSTVSTRFGPKRLIKRIMSAYNDDKKYSVDLVGAVLRQGSFVDKMYKIGWTNPEHFKNAENAGALANCVARYHTFLDLLASSSSSFYVPTLDIDLVWHTHQLMSDQYKEDCFRYVGRFIDHDDKIEGTKLSSAFDDTCRTWKERYKVDYSYCGCPLPGATFGQRFSKLIGNKTPPGPSVVQLTPPDRSDTLASTHGSDHNAAHFWDPKNSREHDIALQDYSLLSRQKRRREIKSMKGKEKAKDKEVAKSMETPLPHDPAFLVPLPLEVGHTMQCVATDGSLVDGAGGCASGNGICGGGCSTVDGTYYCFLDTACFSTTRGTRQSEGWGRLRWRMRRRLWRWLKACIGSNQSPLFGELVQEAQMPATPLYWRRAKCVY
ncbi:hypothetical protein B0H34DRAFT_392677 [Crassisporium funariophilum]|nr:hypothetical protein B0H34DRAFT_392677 [Crassisporium funariophilum]